MKCYLVRHGQTTWNETHRFQGWQDIELTNVGVNQAHKISTYFNDIHYHHLYSSDLVRALKTAQIIQTKHECPMTITKGLRELDVGEWEGLTWDEVTEKLDDENIANMDDLWKTARTGGESLFQFQERVIQAFKTIVNKSANQDIVIVTHGGVIRVLICHILEIEMSEINYSKIDNGSITILEIQKNKHIEIIKQNIIEHLSH
jgi:alpha-ribazole phosphatase